MQFYEKKENQLIFRNDGETLIICPWGKNSLRVRSTFLVDIPEGSAALLDPQPFTAAISIDGNYATITNGNITASLYVNIADNRLQITYTNAQGKVLLKEVNPSGALCIKPRHFKPLPGGTYKLKVSFQSDPSEKIYGMGQYQQEVLNLKGCNLELAHRNSQASVPFYISSLGYGFLWNNAAIGEVHFGSNTTEWVAESTKLLDYWITAGDTPAQIEETYASVTGTAPMMPEYGLGYWQCKLRYYNQEQVLEIARDYKKRGIPVDVLVIDYYHWLRCGDYRFDPEYFPNPEAMVKELADMGIETMVSIWPQIDWRSENYQEMKQQNMLVKSNSGVDVQMHFHGNNVFMDPTNPRTRKYVWNKIKENYADLGIHTFWLDEAEPEFTTYDFADYRYHEGPVTEIGNIYPREYARMFYEGLQESGQKEVVSLIRCAWAGSQRYGALVWSGDIMSTYEDFRKQICAGIHMGISGIPWWTTDIGGFHGGNVNDPDFKELLIRWFQYGTFLPVMRMHGSRIPHSPIINKAGEVREKTGAPNEVWSYGEENYEIMVKFINIRQKMRDYTRSLMEETHKTGAPLIRGMFYEFPEDSVCWDIKDQYMYGADILVAPVCHKNTFSREVYLPIGSSWTDARNGKVYEGGQTLTVDAPIETLPIFLRDGKQEYLIGMI